MTRTALRNLGAAQIAANRLDISCRKQYLRVTLTDVRFAKKGRYYLTLTADGREARTDVCEQSTKTPKFKSASHDLALSVDNDLSAVSLTISATQLMFQGCQGEWHRVGALARAGGRQPRLADGAGGNLTDEKNKVLGTVRFSWCVVDPKAARGRRRRRRRPRRRRPSWPSARWRRSRRRHRGALSKGSEGGGGAGTCGS